jgi:release factor glutamine methyltransferase
MATVEGLLRDAVERIRAAGSDSPGLDAELLLAGVLGIDRMGILAHPEAPVGEGAAAHFEEAVTRREAGEPVAYIRGIREFLGLAFAIDRRALIPRPETEQLVEVAATEIGRRLTGTPRMVGAPPIRVIDVGTGSGAIAVALAVRLRQRRMLEEVDILAVDIAGNALDLARENAVSHAVGDRVRFAPADLVPAAEAPFDLVLANLPYVATTVLDGLGAGFAFEPRQALDGGPDGLAVVGRLVALLPEVLAEGGLALLEIGADQADAVLALGAGLPGRWATSIEPDLAGLPRIARLGR